MPVSAEKIEELYIKITERIKRNLYISNSQNTLEDFLKSISCSDLLVSYHAFYDNSKAKILVIGDSRISQDQMVSIAKRNGIHPKRIEFRLDYDKNKHFDFSSLKYNSNYSDIIIGPNAHKAVGIQGYNSPIAMIEAESSSFPKLTKAEVDGELKITKTSFLRALKETQLYYDLMVC